MNNILEWLFQHADRFCTPQEWGCRLNVRILDPDGWRHGVKGYPPQDFNLPIGLTEFIVRLSYSTTV